MAFDFKPGVGQYNSYKGQYTDVIGAVVAAPKGRSPISTSPRLTWSFHDFDYTILGHYVPAIVDLGDTHASVGSPLTTSRSTELLGRLADLFGTFPITTRLTCSWLTTSAVPRARNGMTGLESP